MSNPIASPDGPNLLEQAIKLHEEGALSPADHLYRRVLDREPENFDALLYSSALKLQQNELNAALGLAVRAARVDPTSAEAQCNCGAIYQAMGRTDDASACFELALAIQPNSPEAHYGLGLARQTQSKDADAVTCFERALLLDPSYVEAAGALGLSFRRLGRVDDAIAMFERALALDGGSADVHNALAEALREKGFEEEAITHFERAIALRPDFPAALNNLGSLQQALGRYDAALVSFDAALTTHPDYAAVWTNKGFALQELGRFEDAREAFSRAIALEPREPAHLFGYVNARRVSPNDPHLPLLIALSRESLGPRQQVQLEFALGKVQTDLGQKFEGFSHYLRGNKLHRDQITYDESVSLKTLCKIPEAFSRDRFEGLNFPEPTATSPIFVVGMPRSGSTLVEQILASHPDVCALGERDDFIRAMGQSGLDGSQNPFPLSILTAKPEQLSRLAELYTTATTAAAREELRQIDPSGIRRPRRSVDKTLVNFVNIGVIGLALPGARVIHIKRNPIDTCLSCFTKLFSQAQNFSYDLGELGRHYVAYIKVMEHWRRVLPQGLVLDVSYPSLVENLEAETRKILDHCGLPWNDACLSFHETKRAVRTASATQVRSPLYRDSLSPWHPPAELLSPLLREFERAGLDSFALHNS